MIVHCSEIVVVLCVSPDEKRWFATATIFAQRCDRPPGLGGMTEQRLWDRLVATHHDLGFNGTFGRALRQVAVVNDGWVALLGWQAGAFKVGVRDRQWHFIIRSFVM